MNSPLALTVRTKIQWPRLLVALFACLPGFVLAQATDVEADARAMREAAALRSAMADAVAKGTEKPAAALVRLKSQNKASGLKLEAELDFAYASLDLGHRLLAMNRPDEAEKFFQAAEQSLEQVVKRTPDSQSRDKAEYLQKLAHVRVDCLGKGAQAKQDIEQAVALQPDDKDLKRAREHLFNSQAQFADKGGQKN